MMLGMENATNRPLPWRAGGEFRLLILDADGNPLGSTSSGKATKMLVDAINALHAFTDVLPIHEVDQIVSGIEEHLDAVSGTDAAWTLPDLFDDDEADASDFRYLPDEQLMMILKYARLGRLYLMSRQLRRSE